MTSNDDPNIASALSRMAESIPDSPAIRFPKHRAPDGTWRYETATYAELDEKSRDIAAGLNETGIEPGMRSVLMVEPSIEFFALTFGLFKAGVVPVMVDPGMGLKNLKTCLAEAEPHAFIGVPKAQAARIFLRWGTSTVEHVITVGRRWLWGGSKLGQIEEKGQKADWTPPEVDSSDTAAILFTSGSTGVPKGAVYTHGNFAAQVEIIRDTYDIEPGEIDLPTFPLFALFDPALGMTTVLPEMDFANPATVEPRNLVEPIEQFEVTNMFGSPVVMDRLGRWGADRDVELSSLKRVISAGAPVPSETLRRVESLLDGAEIHTPYGATESLPVATIASGEILSETAEKTDQGTGVCVGRPVDAIDVEVIEITDEAIEQWSDDLVVDDGEIGEFVVCGPQVTHRYFNREAETRLAKIADGDSIRHRMGDVGYFDDEGRMWFCGRKSHRVILDDGKVMFTVCYEAVFNTHPKVFRTALVGVEADRDGTTIPVLCVELEEEHRGAVRDEVKNELFKIGEEYDPETIPVFLFRDSFPVDVRHNSKIFREELSKWASGQLRT